MPRAARSITLALLVLGASPAGAQEIVATPPPPRAAAPGPSVNGLMPLWEQTGVLHARGSGQVGYAHAQLGLGPVQVGTQPFLDLYGTLNANAKVALWRGGQNQVAITTSVFRVPTAAEARAIGDLHRTGFSNPYGPTWLLPVTVAHTHSWRGRVHLHTAATALTALGSHEHDRHVSGGLTTMLEAGPEAPWAARLHGGVSGVGVAGMGHVGLSFAYRHKHLMLAAGYARRFSFAGEQRSLVLFDGALLWQ